MLDQHRARFGAKGALEPEARVTRIEALLRLGRHDQALALLDAQALTPTGVGREMLVARAELRAEKGRCGAALNDFNLLLATEAPPDLVTERALYGRATCRAQQSDWAGARSDLEHYLARFPKGRFADQARTAIGQ
jgi:TolA-binding protein